MAVLGLRNLAAWLGCALLAGSMPAQDFGQDSPQNAAQSSTQSSGQDDPDVLVLPARVLKVLDGDTVRVQLQNQQIKVRLHGVDAPELKQAHGRAAAKALRALVDGREVELEPVEQDRYDRLVARLFVEGADAGARMVETGFAWAYRRYLGQVPETLAYCDLEAHAREQGRGLWTDPSSGWVPPWTFRGRDADGAGQDYALETAQACRSAAGSRVRKAEASSPDLTGTGDDCPIKGNINARGERIYHAPDSPYYDITRVDTHRGERWFCSEAEARAAGWRAPR